jgi:hypothetical protein
MYTISMKSAKATTSDHTFSSLDRAQFVIDNFRDMTDREIALKFGWVEDGAPNLDFVRAVQRVKNLKKSLEKKFKDDGLSLKKRDDLSTITKDQIRIPSTLKKHPTKLRAGQNDHSASPPISNPVSHQNLSLSRLKESEGSIRGSRQGVPREGYSRITMIIRKDYYQRVEKIKSDSGKSIREIMDEVFAEFFKNNPE